MTVFIKKSRSLHLSPLGYLVFRARSKQWPRSHAGGSVVGREIEQAHYGRHRLPSSGAACTHLCAPRGGSELPNPEHPLEVPERSAADTATFGEVLCAGLPGSAAISLHGVNAHHDVAITHSVFNDLTCRRVYMRIRTWSFPILYNRGRESYSIGTALRHSHSSKSRSPVNAMRGCRNGERDFNTLRFATQRELVKVRLGIGGMFSERMGWSLQLHTGPDPAPTAFSVRSARSLMLLREKEPRGTGSLWQFVKKFSQRAPSGMELVKFVKFHARRELGPHSTLDFPENFQSLNEPPNLKSCSTSGESNSRFADPGWDISVWMSLDRPASHAQVERCPENELWFFEIASIVREKRGLNQQAPQADLAEGRAARSAPAHSQVRSVTMRDTSLMAVRCRVPLSVGESTPVVDSRKKGTRGMTGVSESPSHSHSSRHYSGPDRRAPSRSALALPTSALPWSQFGASSVTHEDDGRRRGGA
ncbi:hypothetical protein FB451DRAFT_1372142 [Mycena latifolia]|nr:hypothetical protein FB451DRAFT_1372142 [Mycena latifolia]